MAEGGDDYKVGYRKPPEHTRFRKGQSGNPTGRPKGSKNLRAILSEIGHRKVQVTTKNGVRSMTVIEATGTQLANQAMSGKLPAIRELLQWWQKFCEDDVTNKATANGPNENDRAVMQSILKRIRRVSDQPTITPEPNDEER